MGGFVNGGLKATGVSRLSWRRWMGQRRADADAGVEVVGMTMSRDGLGT